jgi:hypothetical protein
MTEREKVIDDLEEQIAWIRDNDFHKFPGWGHAVLAMRDALALLKAQEPRVMTLEEVKQHNNQDGCVWFEQPTYNADAAFVLKEDFMIQVISPYILGEPINHGYWTNGNYGKTWRCWTSRPTDEQREAVKWE